MEPSGSLEIHSGPRCRRIQSGKTTFFTVRKSLEIVALRKPEISKLRPRVATVMNSFRPMTIARGGIMNTVSGFEGKSTLKTKDVFRLKGPVRKIDVCEVSHSSIVDAPER